MQLTMRLFSSLKVLQSCLGWIINHNLTHLLLFYVFIVAELADHTLRFRSLRWTWSSTDPEHLPNLESIFPLISPLRFKLSRILIEKYAHSLLESPALWFMCHEMQTGFFSGQVYLYMAGGWFGSFWFGPHSRTQSSIAENVFVNKSNYMQAGSLLFYDFLNCVEFQ